MSTEQKKRLKTFLFGYGALVVVFLIVWAVVSTDHHFNVVKQQQVESKYGPDGRAAVGSTESYDVQMSMALAWSGTNKTAGAFKSLVPVLFLALGLFFYLVWNDTIQMERDTFNWIFVIGMGIITACMLAAYASAYTSNVVSLTPEQYQFYQGHFEDAFTKPLIR